MTDRRKKVSLSSWAVVVAATFGAGMLWAASEPEQREHHSEHHAGALELVLNDGARWATDEALRAGMNGIFKAFDQAHDAYRAGELETEGVAALAEQVEDRVNFMFANCNLPADADAELHKLLAAAFGAAATLRQSDNPHDGLHELHALLKAYGEHFEHPGWSADVSH